MRNAFGVATAISCVVAVTLLATKSHAQAPVYLMEWGTLGTSPGQFTYPLGVAVGRSGDVYITDSSDPRCGPCSSWRVHHYTQYGSFLSQWGGYGDGAGQFKFPDCVAVAPNGDVYISDAGQSRIQKFTSTGALLASWGGYGVGNGQFSNQRGVAVDANGDVLVVDRGNHRVQRFGAEGNFIASWGGIGSGSGHFIYPWGIAIGRDGQVYVTDEGGRVQEFTNSGGFVAQWVGAFGPFSYAYSVAVGPDGSVFVAEGGRAIIQKFTRDGIYITHWGGLGSGPGQFSSLRSVAVDDLGRIYVADSDNNRVQVFGDVPTSLRTSTWGRLKTNLR